MRGMSRALRTLRQALLGQLPAFAVLVLLRLAGYLKSASSYRSNWQYGWRPSKAAYTKSLANYPSTYIKF